MPRKSIAPWSERVSEGLIDQPINSQIASTVDLRPTVDTGFIDQTGTWKGNISSDTNFIALQTDTGIANGAEILTPSSNPDGTWPLDMTGFNDVMIAIKPTSGGAYSFTAIMGPADVSFANLSPVNAGTQLSAAYTGEPSDEGWYAVLYDGSQTMIADKWNILTVYGRAKGHKLLRFKIVNNSGGSSDIETAFMRLV